MADTAPRSNWRPIEVLVVGAVIALLVALILPAIQQSRESARRMIWRNNLKQLGLGLLNYHDNFTQFPLGGTFATDGTPYHGWTTSIAPYLDASPWYSQADFSIPWDDPQQLEHFLVAEKWGRYAPYIDPSVRDSRQLDEGLMAVHTAPNSWLMHRNFGASLNQVTTGAGRTLLLADAHGRYFPFGFPASWRHVRDRPNESMDEFGHRWRPVIHVLMVDGRIDMIRPDIDPAVWQAMAGPDTLRPSHAAVAGLPWPYKPPPGGYWRTEELATVPFNDSMSQWTLCIRKDPAGIARTAYTRAHDKNHQSPSPMNLLRGPLDPELLRLATHTTLESFDAGSFISTDGLKALQSLPRLRSVTMSGARATDDALRILAAFPALTDLSLISPSITDDGLANLDGFSALRRLTIHLPTELTFTPRGLLAFCDAHPLVELRLVSYGWFQEPRIPNRPATRRQLACLVARNRSLWELPTFDQPCDGSTVPP